MEKARLFAALLMGTAIISATPAAAECIAGGVTYSHGYEHENGQTCDENEWRGPAINSGGGDSNYGSGFSSNPFQYTDSNSAEAQSIQSGGGGPDKNWAPDPWVEFQQ